MGAPTLVGKAEWNSGGQVATHYATMPAGIQAGDLIIALTNKADTGAGTPGAGWTLLNTVGVNDQNLRSMYRIAVGNESGTNIIVRTTTSGTSAVTHTWVYRGHVGVPEGSQNSGTLIADVDTPTPQAVVNPNPPAITPSWGAIPSRFIACVGWQSDAVVTAYPANYTDGIDTVRGTAVAVGSAHRAATVATEDAAAFTISKADMWTGVAVAIKGTADVVAAGRSQALIIG